MQKITTFLMIIIINYMFAACSSEEDEQSVIADLTAPSFLTTSAVHVSENSVYVSEVVAIDESRVRYELLADQDSLHFFIEDTTGVLTFREAPDFEDPQDSDLNNVYEVTVIAEDAQGNSSQLLLKITVDNDLDENETNMVPLVDAGNDQNILVQDIVQMQGEASDSDGVVVSYQWREGDRVLANTRLFDYSSTVIGQHTLTLQVTDDDGASASDLVIITVIQLPNTPPAVDAGADLSVDENERLSITGSAVDSDGEIISYQWKEGITLLAERAAFTHSFSQAGSHTLTLSATDNSGATASDTMMVTVRANEAPSADAGVDRRAVINERVRLTGVGSDVDGQIVTYRWSEDNVILSQNSTFDYISSITGVHILSFTVIDDDGALATDMLEVRISEPYNALPVVNAGEDKSVKVNEVLRISGSATDSDGSISSYRWSEEGILLASRASFEYSSIDAGVHTLVLSVTDNGGASATDEMLVNVIANVPPTADAGIDQSAEVNHDVTLSGMGSDSDGTVVSYTWKEGTAVLASNASFVYQFTTAGTHRLTLYVTDNDGAVTTDDLIITVSENTNASPVVDAGSDQDMLLDETITIVGSASDSDGSISEYRWTEGTTLLASSPSFIYTATSAGLHTLTLSVKDNSANEATDTMQIRVVRVQKLLIIRIEFNDYQFEHDAQQWSQKIFGTQEGELNHYYNEISYGTFRFEKAVEHEGSADGVITVALNENHPDHVENKLDRFVSAVTLANPDIDFAAYDSDGNNALSASELQIMFLVAGGERATGASPGVWAYQWCMYGVNETPPVLDGVQLMSCLYSGNYSAFGEKHNNAQTGDDATIGVIAHELGHAVFALPDLYDTDNSSEGIGNFGLMGGGSWGYKPSDANSGQTPVHMTGWSKVKSGFLTPTLITSTRSAQEVKATSSSDYTLYQLPTGRNGEYFLLENRAASGYDRGLYSLAGNGDYLGGLSILHIDDTVVASNSSSDVNDDESHKKVDVEEASEAGLDLKLHSGHYDNLYYLGNKTYFNDTSSPDSKRYGGTASGVSVTNVSSRGAVMQVDIELP